MERHEFLSRDENGDLIIDPETPWFQAPFFRRVLTLVFPPLGLALLWTNRNLTRCWKGFEGTLILLYLIPYVVGLVLALDWLGLVAVEWKGGFGPSVVWHKTKPNYLELELHRTAHQTDPGGAASSSSPAYWTSFRGPRRDGVYAEQPILTDWSPPRPARKWRQPCGGGYASFAVAEGRAFTIEQRRDDEVVVAYDVATGRELWTHAYPARFEEWMGGEGPRATPTYHDGLVYSLGATGELCCLGAANGRLLWQKNILTENSSANLRYGMAASPLVIGERVIVLTGEATTGRAVVAYNRLNGDRAWSVLDDKQAYTTPLLATLAGEPQLVVVTASRAVGLSPVDGALRWEFPWRVQYDNAISIPVIVGTNRLVLSAGYGAGSALVEVTRGAKGFEAREVWRNRNLKNKFNASVLWDGFLYGLDEGVLACVDVATGERRWRDGRYGYGQLLVAGGYLILLGGEGELVLLRADPQRWVELARVQALNGKTWNVPALAQGFLLVRNSAMMACYDLRIPPPMPR